ncbi:hypothetical protein EJB05_28652, partial [Eragrostis curvula]
MDSFLARLYTDNLMFGSHVEKQQIINTLLNDPGAHGTPTVLPVIGGCRVVLFINGHSISRLENVKFSNERTLAIVEFVTDVDDDNWKKFYSTIERMTAEGSKVIIIIANELAKVLGWSLVTVNLVADLLHRNLDRQFWLRIFHRFKRMVDYNLSKYCDHPKDILDKEH